MAQTTSEQESALCDELKAYCAAQGLPHRCAMDLQAIDITDEQRTWLSGFSKRWEAWEERESAQHTIYQRALQELSIAIGEPVSEDDEGMRDADDESLVGWADDLAARVGLKVEPFKAILEAYIGVRNGSMEPDDALLALEGEGDDE